MTSENYLTFATFELLRFIAHFGSEGVPERLLTSKFRAGAGFYSCLLHSLLHKLVISGNVRMWRDHEGWAHYAATYESKALLRSIEQVYKINMRVYPTPSAE